MPARVDGFVPARLRMAREARLLRQKELAELVECSDTSISRWESLTSKQTPEPSLVPELARVLEVDVSWFLKPVPPNGGASFFRSLQSSLGQLRDKAQARLGFVEAIYETIAQHVDLPDVDVPDFLEGRDPRHLRISDVERIAYAVREYWNLADGPVEDLLLVMENAGIVIAEDEVGSSKLDGVSRWCGARPFVLLAKDKDVGVRRRFDAAHELGHVVLHRSVSAEVLSANFGYMEEQAMAFAGAFLMPEDSFQDDVFSLSLDALVGIKTKWNVSVGAMIKRLSSLGLISEVYERRLWQYYSYRRWRQGEPFDDMLPVEQPQNLGSSIKLIIDESLMRKREFLQDIGLSKADVVTLTGVPWEYLEEDGGNVVRLEPQLRRRQPIDRLDLANGDVVRWPDREK